MDKKQKHGGNRPGAGRPKTGNPPRTIRGLSFNDAEWEAIRAIAAEQGMSVRAYITALVDAEKNKPEGEVNMEEKRNNALQIENWMELSELGYWLVDDMIFDPHIYLNGHCVVKDRGQYYRINFRGGAKNTVDPLPGYIDSPAYDRPRFNHEYIVYGIEPRAGFKPIEIGRAITNTEWDELVDRFKLTDDDISDEYENKKGDIYGPKTRVIFTTRQIRINSNAIKLETELRDKGIEASSENSCRVTIRVK